MLFVNLNQGIGPHQAALADALYRVLGKDYVFIEFGRKGNGQVGSFKNMSKGVDYYKDRPYILKMYESEENARLAKELLAKADVVRTGGEPLELVLDRIMNGKLTFRSTERVCKGSWWNNLKKLVRLRQYYNPLSNPNYRILCQSAYMANDMQYCDRSYREKCYKFAYFTSVPVLDINQIINARNNKKLQIIWCSRFIDWKHPEMPVLLAKKLIDSGRDDFEVQMIGANTTLLWETINRLILEKGVQNHVTLVGGIPNKEVLERMRKSHIFIFTSDRGEGWGAVLNEAMGAGCACVASHEIGSVPFLLKKDVNGLIFKSRSVDSLFEKVSYLYDNRELCDRLGKEAYHTISTDWSAQTAASRLINLSESILSGNEIAYEEGPCSKAYPINPKSLVV